MRFLRFTRVAAVFLALSPTALACSTVTVIWSGGPGADALYRFVVNGKAGYINSRGNILIEPAYKVFGNSGGRFYNGFARIGAINDLYIDTNGQRAEFGTFDRARDFSEGLAAVLPEYGGKWGYIDTSGAFAIPPQIEGYPDDFSNGMAKIMTEGELTVGYLDRAGTFAIEPRFLWGTRFKEGRAWVILDGPCFHFDLTQPCGLTGILPSSESNPSTVATCELALIDKAGRIVSSERFSQAYEFSEGLAGVLRDGLWGYVDQTGFLAILPRFDDVSAFSEGLAAARLGDRYGYIDRNGAFAIPPQFASASPFADGRAVVRDELDGPYRYIDDRGNSAFPGEFQYATSFYKGLAHIDLLGDSPTINYGWFAYIDIRGRVVFAYENAPP